MSAEQHRPLPELDQPFLISPMLSSAEAEVPALREPMAVVPTGNEFQAVTIHEPGYGTVKHTLQTANRIAEQARQPEALESLLLSSIEDQLASTGQTLASVTKETGKGGVKRRTTAEARQQIVVPVYEQIIDQAQGDYTTVKKALSTARRQITTDLRGRKLTKEEAEANRGLLRSIEYRMKKDAYVDFLDIAAGYDATHSDGTSLPFRELVHNVGQVKRAQKLRTSKPVDVLAVASQPKEKKVDNPSTFQLAHEIALQIAASTPKNALQTVDRTNKREEAYQAQILTEEARGEAADVCEAMLARCDYDYVKFGNAMSLAYQQLKRAYGAESEMNEKVKAALRMMQSVRGSARWYEQVDALRAHGQAVEGLSAFQVAKNVKEMKLALETAGEKIDLRADAASFRRVLTGETTTIEEDTLSRLSQSVPDLVAQNTVEVQPTTFPELVDQPQPVAADIPSSNTISVVDDGEPIIQPTALPIAQVEQQAAELEPVVVEVKHPTSQSPISVKVTVRHPDGTVETMVRRGEGIYETTDVRTSPLVRLKGAVGRVVNRGLHRQPEPEPAQTREAHGPSRLRRAVYGGLAITCLATALIVLNTGELPSIAHAASDEVDKTQAAYVRPTTEAIAAAIAEQTPLAPSGQVFEAPSLYQKSALEAQLSPSIVEQEALLPDPVQTDDNATDAAQNDVPAQPETNSPSVSDHQPNNDSPQPAENAPRHPKRPESGISSSIFGVTRTPDQETGVQKIMAALAQGAARVFIPDVDSHGGILNDGGFLVDGVPIAPELNGDGQWELPVDDLDNNVGIWGPTGVVVDQDGNIVANKGDQVVISHNFEPFHRQGIGKPYEGKASFDAGKLAIGDIFTIEGARYEVVDIIHPDPRLDTLPSVLARYPEHMGNRGILIVCGDTNNILSGNLAVPRDVVIGVMLPNQ